MHACGHDIHMTNLVGVARYLGSHKDQWQGTLMLIGQPAEERVGGAKAMLEDGLFTRFPKPDFALALHVAHDTAAGKVAYRAGYALANVDSVDITVKGRGGHGAAPHTAIDPIVQAAELVVALQSIVSREVKPLEPAVITVGSIHGGTKHNIIDDECRLQLTVRSYADDVRKQLLEAIERKANAVTQGHRAPAPDVKFSEGTPSLYNDDELAARLASIFEHTLGNDNVGQAEAVMGAEDFSLYGKAGVPILMYRLGSVSQRRLDQFKMAGQTPPSLHSAAYYPDFELTLRTGIATMSHAVLELMPRR
jgi:hippurate hydrolase